MLNEGQVKNSKPKDKKYLLNDSKGLYLRVDPSGRKYWIFRFFEQGKNHEFSLGVYPEISLKEARDKRDKLQQARANGELLSTRPDKTPVTFSEASAQWLKIRMKDKAENYLKSINLRLKKYILPAIGHLDLDSIKSPVVLNLCRKIEDKEFIETAHRVRAVIGQVFRFAIASGWCENDPTVALRGAPTARSKKHFSTMLDTKDIKILVSSIKSYPFDILRCAMLFSLYTVARPGEIRQAEWKEIDGAFWYIPAEKMKMKRPHIVPLSKQALEVLEELKLVSGNGRYLFPTPRNTNKCISENAVRIALRSMGFTKEQIVPHGFRAMFSTVANENNFNRDVIERQLAHVEANAVRGAYNRAEYMPARIELMQWWADWLDNL